MDDPPRQYRSYLLRLWQFSQDGVLAWRGSIEDVQNQNRFHFSRIEDLLAYLLEICQSEDNP